jgi:hypothetical protein
MNRSILIVICDFLLVSLLAFSTVDINKTTSEGVPRQVKTTIATNLNESRQDLAAVMRLALEQERKGRELLVGELTRTREALSQQQALLGEREKQVQTFRQELQQKEQQTTQLEQQQTNLLQQFAAAQTNVQTLSQQFLSSSTEALISKEKLAALQQQLGQLAQSNQLVLTEKQRLAGQLQVAEAEKRLVAEQAARMQEEVKVERAEKAKLAEGVKALASSSDQLAQEIQQNRPLAPNTIFNQFVTNRVQASFWAVRAGFLGLESNKRAETRTVLVTDGTNTVALCHVQDTPLRFGYPGTDWQRLTGTLERYTASIAMRLQGLSHLVRPLQVPGCGGGRGAGRLLRRVRLPD